MLEAHFLHQQRRPQRMRQQAGEHADGEFRILPARPDVRLQDAVFQPQGAAVAGHRGLGIVLMQRKEIDERLEPGADAGGGQRQRADRPMRRRRELQAEGEAEQRVGAVPGGLLHHRDIAAQRDRSVRIVEHPLGEAGFAQHALGVDAMLGDERYQPAGCRGLHLAETSRVGGIGTHAPPFLMPTQSSHSRTGQPNKTWTEHGALSANRL